jgi:uncharacterized membrane protein YbhN (UPF0104 family)
MASGLLARAMPWGGLVAGALAVGLQQQILADLLHFRCTDERWIGLAVGAAAALLTLLGGFASWRALRARRAMPELEPRRFVAELGLAAAVFFLFAIVLQTLAAWLAPPCGS